MISSVEAKRIEQGKIEEKKNIARNLLDVLDTN